LGIQISNIKPSIEIICDEKENPLFAVNIGNILHKKGKAIPVTARGGP
jgi:hypothetical protein